MHQFQRKRRFMASTRWMTLVSPNVSQAAAPGAFDLAIRVMPAWTGFFPAATRSKSVVMSANDW